MTSVWVWLERGKRSKPVRVEVEGFGVKDGQPFLEARDKRGVLIHIYPNQEKLYKSYQECREDN